MPRTIHADGRTITVPDDATPDEINQIVGPATIENVPGAVPGMQEPQAAAGPKPDRISMSHVATPQEFGKGFVHTIPSMIKHPVQTAESMIQPALASGMSPIGEGYPSFAPLGTGRTGRLSEANNEAIQQNAQEGQRQSAAAIKENPAYAAGGMTSLLGAGIALHELAPVVRGAGSMIRDAAIGDPDVAAVRAAGVPKKAALGFKNDLQGARPYLAGTKSVEELQNKAGIGGPLRDEIYKPIDDFLSVHGNRVVQGPDGPTTLNDLEAQRGQVSAQLRQLKEGGPEGIALATQKGLNQADLLARQQAIEGALDPHLMAAGIDSPLIRQTYGQVARVGDQFAGRWTPAEKPTPFGFGRLTNIDVARPRTWLGQPAQGVRDLLAGHPLWSGNAGDVGVSDAFRTGGPKPDFRAPISAMPRWENPPRLLESDVPGNAGYGDIDSGSMAGIPHPGPQVTPPPNIRGLLPESGSAPNYMRRYVEPPEPNTIRPMPPEQRPLLPAQASPGETQPYIAHQTMPAGVSGEITRIAPPRFAPRGEILPPSGRIAYPPLPEGTEGPTIGLRPQPHGLLPGAQETIPAPPDTPTQIYPPGSAYRGLPVEGATEYPAGSQFRRNIRPFNIDEYLNNQKPLSPQGTQ